MFLSFQLQVQYKWDHQENSHLEMKSKNEGFTQNSISMLKKPFVLFVLSKRKLKKNRYYYKYRRFLLVVSWEKPTIHTSVTKQNKAYNP